MHIHVCKNKTGMAHSINFGKPNRYYFLLQISQVQTETKKTRASTHTHTHTHHIFVPIPCIYQVAVLPNHRPLSCPHSSLKGSLPCRVCQKPHDRSPHFLLLSPLPLMYGPFPFIIFSCPDTSTVGSSLYTSSQNKLFPVSMTIIYLARKMQKTTLHCQGLKKKRHLSSVADPQLH